MSDIMIAGGILAVIFTSIFIVIGFLLKTALFKKLDDLSTKFDKFKEDVYKSYTPVDTTKEYEQRNEVAHRELWQEINKTRENVARLEVK